MRSLVVLVLLLLAGCGDLEVVAVGSEESGSCGRIEVAQGQGWRKADPAAWDCLDEALRSGGEADLVLVFPTVEGDPITMTYRVDGDVLEVTEDSTQDRFGSGEVTTRSCAAPDRLPQDVHELSCT